MSQTNSITTIIRLLLLGLQWKVKRIKKNVENLLETNTTHAGKTQLILGLSLLWSLNLLPLHSDRDTHSSATVQACMISNNIKNSSCQLTVTLLLHKEKKQIHDQHTHMHRLSPRASIQKNNEGKKEFRPRRKKGYMYFFSSEKNYFLSWALPFMTMKSTMRLVGLGLSYLRLRTNARRASCQQILQFFHLQVKNVLLEQKVLKIIILLTAQNMKESVNGQQ